MTNIPHGFKPHDGNSFRPDDCEPGALVRFRNGREGYAHQSLGWWVWHERGQTPNDIVGYIATAQVPA